MKIRYNIFIKTIRFILLISAVYAGIGCAARKVRSYVQNDPTFDPKSIYSKELSGKSYAVRVYNAINPDSSEIMTSKLTIEVRNFLDAKGFLYVEKVNEADLLVLLSVNSKTATVHVPAQSYWGIGWGNSWGSGGGGSVGAHNTDITNEWIELRVLDCNANPKPKAILEGRSWPKKSHDSFLTNEGRLEIAISKMFSESLFSRILTAPKTRNVASMNRCKP